MSTRKTGFSWIPILVVAGTLALAGGVVAVKIAGDQRYGLEGPGELDGACLVSLADGRRVLVVSSDLRTNSMRSSQNQERVEIIDPSDGHNVVRVAVEKPTFCVEAAPGLLWCDTNLVGGSDLHLRDTATLAVLASHDQVIAQAPPLSRQGAALVDGRTGEAWLLTKDGNHWHVDPRTLKGSAEEEKPRRLGRIGPLSTSGALNNYVATSIGELGFEGNLRETLMVRDQLGVSRRSLLPDPWLHPNFLIDDSGPAAKPKPLLLDQGRVLLLAHEDSIDHNTAQVSLTALGLDGKRRWTTPIGQFEIAAAWILEGRIVLALRGFKQGEVIALDGDGRVLWRTGT